MSTITEDRRSLHTLMSVLPILVFGNHCADAGGTLATLLDETYDSLISLQAVLVARIGTDESMPTIFHHRKPASQRELVRKLEAHVGHVLMHEPCSGALMRELMSLYLALVAFRVRRAA